MKDKNLYFKQSLFSFQIFLFFVLLCQICFSQKTDSLINENKIFHRDYSFIYGIKYDVLNSSENFRSGLKFYSDIYYRSLAPNIDDKAFRNIVGFIWTFTGKWSSILLPHEFGHMLRTNQGGGKFSFVKFQFPGIIGRLEMPDDATLEEHTLSLIGGFEANYLIARDIQLDFFRYNGLWNDELGMAFINRIMYALYTYVFSFQNPRNPQTWKLEGGDPVNFTKLVWEKGRREVFNSDSTVNKNLINFYKQAGAFFSDEMEGKRPFYFGNEDFSWSYGTFFNTSVLSVELYFNNYIKSGKHFCNVYFKYGFPFRDYGVGLFIPDLLTFNNFTFTAQADWWSQEFYGHGIALITNANFKVFEKWRIMAQIGYKTKGYVAGRTTKQGIFGFVGFNYAFK